MSILKSSTSITRFKTTEYNINPIDIIEKLKSNQIKETLPEEEMSFGWTSMQNPYSPMFDDMSFMSGTYITLGLRIDKKYIPKSLLNKEICAAEAKYDGLISKETKNNIKEATKINILSKTQAIPNTYDVIWDNEILYLFSTNKLAVETIEILMKDTFGLDLEIITPFSMSEEYFNEKIISETEPTYFS